MKSRVFRDFDAFAESVQGVDSKMMLRNPRHRVWSTSLVEIEDIDVQFGQLGSGNIAQGELRSDGYMLYLPFTDGVEYSANGRVMDKGSFAILEPGCEFCISTKVEHDWCAVFFPAHMMHLEKEFDETNPSACRVTRPNLGFASRFQEIVQQVMNAATSHSDFESTAAASLAGEELKVIASKIVNPDHAFKQNHEGRPKASREEIISTTLDIFDKKDASLLSVGELATAANVSERTLRTAFNEYFGVGPVRYLQLYRLHQIHRALRVADLEETTVTRILMDHGEWEFSRFASRYRKLFGELPSQTLQANSP